VEEGAPQGSLLLAITSDPGRYTETAELGAVARSSALYHLHNRGAAPKTGTDLRRQRATNRNRSIKSAH